MERRRDVILKKEKSTGWILKSLLAAYVTSCAMLLGISFLLYRFDLTEQTVQIGILVTYVLSAFVGGFVSGKQVKTRRFFWGIILGLFYLIFLILISFGVYRTTFATNELMWAFLACTVGGMAGGMVS